VDRATLIKSKIREKLTEKKLIKILRLKNKNRDKEFKKYILLKRFEDEQEIEVSAGLSKQQKQVRAEMLTKFRTVLVR
jgi:hypothetical protein